MRLRRALHLSGLTLMSEAEVLARVANEPWAGTDDDKLRNAGGGLGRQYAPWRMTLLKRAEEIANQTGDPSARTLVNFVLEVRGSIISGRTGAGFLAELAQLAQMRGVIGDRRALAEIAFARDVVNRYPLDYKARIAAVTSMDLFEPLDHYAPAAVTPPGTWGNTPVEALQPVISPPAEASTSSSSSGGGTSSSSTYTAPSSYTPPVYTSSAQTGQASTPGGDYPLTKLDWLTLAAAGAAAFAAIWFLTAPQQGGVQR